MNTMKLKVAVFLSVTFLFCLILPVGITNAQSATSTEVVEKNHVAIHADLAAIHYDKVRIAALKDKYKMDKKANDQSAMIADKELISKTQASMHKNESFLTADKRTLMQNHDLAISNAQKDVRDAKANLASNRSMLTKAKYNGFQVTVARYTPIVSRCEYELKKSESNLRSQRLQRDADVIAVNKEVRKVNGEFAGTLYTQNTLATADRWINK